MKQPGKKISVMVALAATIFYAGCNKQQDAAVNPQDGEVGQGTFAQMHPANALLLTKADYDKLPKANWSELQRKAHFNAANRVAVGSMNLNTPPVVNQGWQGSCVGFGIGYCATSILTAYYINYPAATRSAAYVFNQIKISDCDHGSWPVDALNLVINQGDCSNTSFPYIVNRFYKLPHAWQKTEAAQHKCAAYYTLANTDVQGVKNALNWGYPVPVCFTYLSNGLSTIGADGIWRTNTGTNDGGHCTCIVGYDDATGMFKIQNSWGNDWAKNGFFYISYTNFQKGWIDEVYVLQD